MFEYEILGSVFNLVSFVTCILSLCPQVGRALQPSVFYIGECEKMFKKKIPKTDPVST